MNVITRHFRRPEVDAVEYLKELGITKPIYDRYRDFVEEEYPHLAL